MCKETITKENEIAFYNELVSDIENAMVEAIGELKVMAQQLQAARKTSEKLREELLCSG